MILKVLTVKELSGILNIGLSKAYTLMRSKAFPSYRLGGKYYITDEALFDWLRKAQGKTINLWNL